MNILDQIKKYKSLQVTMRPMFGAFGKAGSANSISFVSKVWFSLPSYPPPLFSFTAHAILATCNLHPQVALDSGVKELYGLDKRVEAVGNVRKLTKLDMKLNDALPDITVDPETYTVTADGEVLSCSAANTVPLSRNYFLF